ncbi:MAG: UPF0175 family protein [Armatimonadetes bacterium]|nr:UPF0175 family protein [Armatimonadota bacterium]
MAGLVLEIPEDVAEAIRIPRAEREDRLRREIAIRLYDKGFLSFGKASELAGMGAWDFHRLLGDEGIVRNYDLEELQEDLRTLELVP